MRIFLDDSRCRHNLVPLTHTRHVADIRVGILTIREKWQHLTGKTIVTDPASVRDSDLVMPAGLLPSLHNVDTLLKASRDKISVFDDQDHEIRRIQYPWHIYQHNDWALRRDFELLTRGRQSAPVSSTNRLIEPAGVFLEQGAVMEHCIINATTGPVYIGKNAELMEGCLVRGALALCEGAIMKMGTRTYGATTLGPYSTAGGEIKNSVFQSYSNKAHDGYLGDSVIGSWCNLGAGTSNSNVKNTGGMVKYLTGNEHDMVPAGQKAGLIMGDYSRAAINTTFNTGTIVGVCCNIFGSRLPPKFIPSFSWGDERYDIEKAIQDIDNWKKMKSQSLSDDEKKLLYELYLTIN
jgi:UDP-N-acetylglucosamine diphosphorylase/glucosamine-1-phosphate N-acetyltransferase